MTTSYPHPRAAAPRRLRASASALLACCVLAIAACGDDDIPPIGNDEETITTVTLSLTANNETQRANYLDEDGDPATPPQITGVTLEPNTVYSYRLTLSNTLEMPAEDITAEIRAEDEAHQFFFISDVDGLTVEPSDLDGDGNPVGLLGTVTTGGADMGELRVVLRHELDKSAAGVSDGDIANAGGETDVDIPFPLTVEGGSGGSGGGGGNPDDFTTYAISFVAGGDTTRFSYRDLDGAGGDDPEVSSTGSLSYGVDYDFFIEILNENVTPARDMVEEVIVPNGTMWQVFTKAENTQDIRSWTQGGDNYDSNGDLIGISGTYRFLGPVANGMDPEFRGTVVMNPNKDAVGVGNGTINNAGGTNVLDGYIPITFN